MLYKSTMQKLFKSSNLQEFCMKYILYLIYMKIHKTVLHYVMKMINPHIAKNPILIKLKTLNQLWMICLILFINSQNHSDDQLDQVFQTYQAYTASQSPTRQVYAHITYHVAQANQAMHASFVDRGANGGLAGSDVRVLDTSSRQCTVIGINNHETPGLDIVQCAALGNTNHDIVDLIMNEYAYNGKVILFIQSEQI